MSRESSSEYVDTDSITGPSDVPSYPECSGYDTRLATFNHWEPYIGPFSTEELARAGFFVSNLLRNTKAIFCFYCNLFVSERTLRSFDLSVDCLHGTAYCKFTQSLITGATSPSEEGTNMEGRTKSTATQAPPVPPRGPKTRSSAAATVTSIPIAVEHNEAAAYVNKEEVATLDMPISSRLHYQNLDEMNAELRPQNSLDDSWDDLTDDTYETIGRDFASPVDPLIGGVITPKMDTFAARLATFANWPADSPQDPTTFAKYGMFYTGKGDRTQCHACGVLVWGWDPYKGNRKAPLLAHKKFYRDCKFLQDRSWSDTTSKLNPIGPMINWDKADAPHMLTDTARMSTYKLLFALDQEKAKAMSDAGFYYCADTSQVKCFFCGCATNLAEAKANPWTAHAQASDSCTFLNRRKGYLFILKARRKSDGHSLSVDNSAADAEADSNPVKEGAVKHILNKIVTPTTRDQLRKDIQKNSRMAFESVRAFVKGPSSSGSPSRPASERRSSIREDEPPSPPPLQPASSVPAEPPKSPFSFQTNKPGVLAGTNSVAVLPPVAPERSRRSSARDDTPSASPPQITVPMEPRASTVPATQGVSDSELEQLSVVRTVISMGFTSKQVERAMAELTKDKTLPPATAQIHTADRLVQTILDLVESESMLASDNKPPGNYQFTPTERLCVICMEQISNIVMVPCGHVKTCIGCSEKVTHCPMCRQSIQDRIRIYL